MSFKKPQRSILVSIALVASIALGALVAGGLAIYGVGYWIFGGAQNPEVQLLAQTPSPNGRLEARLLRVIGGPPMGGAIVWQEVQIVSSGSSIRFLDQKHNPGLVLSILEDSETPVATLEWKGPNRLMVEAKNLASSPIQNKQVLGVNVEFCTSRSYINH